MADPPIWDTDGRDWPNRASSRFVTAAGLRWHVQIAGDGPVVLLLHGTGAATHSWRGVLPLLAAHFTVVAPDLPGHGFTEAPPPPRLSLPGMAWQVTELLQALDMAPELVVGHSAGAAVLARMVLDERITPRAVISLNGALLPLAGMAGELFAPIARLLTGLWFVPAMVARRAARPGAVEKLLSGTGSRLGADGVAFYARLFRRRGHVAATIAMMANWDLRPLARDLPALGQRLILVAADGDRTIPPSQARRLATLVPGARLIIVPGLGHLAHEEDPALVRDILRDVRTPVPAHG